MFDPNLSSLSNLSSGPSLSPNDFLTEEESIAVDRTLMPAKDKFSTRVAIYSLRVFQSMAAQQLESQPESQSQSQSQSVSPKDESDRNYAIALDSITPKVIIEWLAQHQPPAFEATPGLETDPSFNQFFAQLVLSALKPLKQISTQLNQPITDLTSAEIINWFEQNVQL